MDEHALIERQLQELELSLLQPDARKSARVGELLADGFVEFGSSGRVMTKREIVAALQSEVPTTITASDLRVRLLSTELALVTYRALHHGDPAIVTLRSSIWQRQDGRWRMVFHQGTLAAPSR
ncbi:MAG TPA: DUF4440 domain-containing protein [Pirellulales bacterium]|nr:DUF4440 domain-containing protein [Pirellulales bacterium]